VSQGSHRSRDLGCGHRDGLQLVGVVEEGIKGGVAADAGLGASFRTGSLSIVVIGTHGGIGLERLLQITPIADLVAVPEHLVKLHCRPLPLSKR